MQRKTIHPAVGGAIVLLFSLVLSACILMPGKFVSELDIRKDGRFSYSYAGEMHMLPLSKLAEMDGKAKAEFEPEKCYFRDSGKERQCSVKEIEDQRAEWEQRQARKAEKDKREAESAKMFMGGIDPSDPEAASEFAERLRRQAGWRKVVYKGDGLFDVDFAISGRLDHDFTFPTIERLPMANAFVQVSLREDGTVRIDAPGFGPGASGSPFGGLMQMAAMSGGKDGKDAPKIPEIDGAFTITTDGVILANNTDEGPQPDPSGQRLEWKISAQSPAAPTALLRLGS
ncbi:MAG: hypothetical protein H6917_00950 [Novosphingobium sp.]|nr:hypothetical protein [Novosphingobium sp.]MCP5400936.1 hypothetical protein [Novosphingobium sp.]